MKQKSWGALALVTVLSPAFGADTASIRYRCVQLPENDHKETRAVGVSPKGHVAGIMNFSKVPMEALVWYRNEVTKPAGLMLAFGVNDLGHVVGMDADSVGTLWKDGVGTALHAPPGSLDGFTYPTDINNKGEIVGYVSYGTQNWHAATWVDGAVTDLGTLDNDLSKDSRAIAINRYGDIVGSSAEYAVLWKRRSHAMVKLPSSAAARAINADGLIVGYGTYPGGAGNQSHALAWTTQGSVTDLGTLPFGKDSRADAVNSAGVIVGSSDTDDAESTFATVWYGVGQAPVDLNSVLAGAGCRDRAGYRFVLNEAVGVTGNGTIVANGRPKDGSADNVRTLAFRLIPRTVVAQ